MFNKLQKAIVLGVGVFALGLFQSASADWEGDTLAHNGLLEPPEFGNSAGVPQDIVITLKTDPKANPEQACLAVTFARMLSGQPDHNVTLFVTLDGVALAKDQGKRAHRRMMCTTPWEEQISLIDNLKEFLDKDGEDGEDGEDGISLEESRSMVVCPLCWVERYGLDEDSDPPQPVAPDYGVLPGLTAAKNAIAVMIGNAEKILDF